MTETPLTIWQHLEALDRPDLAVNVPSSILELPATMTLTTSAGGELRLHAIAYGEVLLAFRGLDPDRTPIALLVSDDSAGRRWDSQPGPTGFGVRSGFRPVPVLRLVAASDSGVTL